MRKVDPRDGVRARFFILFCWAKGRRLGTMGSSEENVLAVESTREMPVVYEQASHKLLSPWAL